MDIPEATTVKATERGTKNSLHLGHPCGEFRARKSWQILQTAQSRPRQPLDPFPIPPFSSPLLFRSGSRYSRCYRFDSLRDLLSRIFDKVTRGDSRGRGKDKNVGGFRWPKTARYPLVITAFQSCPSGEYPRARSVCVLPLFNFNPWGERERRKENEEGRNAETLISHMAVRRKPDIK